MTRRVAIIGAGWSGLACALELTRCGHQVSLFDAAAHAGGRARRVALTLGDRDYALDNGQHLLIGAYRETLRMMREIGVDIDRALLRLPLEICYPDGFELRARRLPAPAHLAAALLLARGLGWPARWHALSWVRRWHRRDWTLAADQPASTLFIDTPAELRLRLWRPLCLAALNVELEQASAQVLLNVLRDSLAADAQGSDLLIPRHDLTRTFVEPAVRALCDRGADIVLRTPVQRLQNDGPRWLLDGRDDVHVADAIVLAVPPQRAVALLESCSDRRLEAPIASLRAIKTAPIATVYVRYAAATRLARPALALRDDAQGGRHGQWVFDRGQLDPDNAGVLSVVISAAGAALELDMAPLAAAVVAQLRTDLALPAPLASTVIAEKRATIVPSPGLQRPGARLPATGLYLAGDAAHSEYPSTLEGSVRSGLTAAKAVIADAQAAAC